MKKYIIKFYYSTGNSFKIQDEEDCLEMSWNNLDIAKENIKAIKEHYQMYEKLDDFRYDRNKLKESNKDKWWFVDTDYYPFDECMKLKADNGNLMQQWNPWCGYFETLYSIEIEVNDPEMKFINKV